MGSRILGKIDAFYIRQATAFLKCFDSSAAFVEDGDYITVYTKGIRIKINKKTSIG